MKVEDIMTNNRVCLKPDKWQMLYNLIQDAYPERQFPKPLILAGWNFSSNTEKRNRFCMHLEFAISAGVANKVLNDIKEEEWYNLNE